MMKSNGKTGGQEGRETGSKDGDLLEDTVGETAKLHEHPRVIRAQEGVAGGGEVTLWLMLMGI